MKKIGIFLSARPSGGGMFQYSQTVLNALAKLPPAEFPVVVAAYTDRIWEQYMPSDRVLHLSLGTRTGFNVLASLRTMLRFPLKVWWKCVGRYSSLVKQVIAQGCDLWIFARQDVWSSQFPVPALVTIHDLMHRYESHFPEVGSHGRACYRDCYIRAACDVAKGILVDSRLGKAHVHESYCTSLEKIHVLPYVPGSCFSDSAGGNGGMCTSPRLPEKFIFYPAQFWEHKNHKRLIEAVALVKHRYPDIKLMLAGSKENGYLQILEQVKRLGLWDSVHFLGYVPDDDIPGIYDRARALIFPTFFGPTNIPPLEALARGCPVAASNIYAMPDQLGDAALYFDPNSVEQIADCTSRLWSNDDLCARLSDKGKLRSKEWNLEQFQLALHAIIRHLTNDAPLAVPETESLLNQDMSVSTLAGTNS